MGHHAPEKKAPISQTRVSYKIFAESECCSVCNTNGTVRLETDWTYDENLFQRRGFLHVALEKDLAARRPARGERADWRGVEGRRRPNGHGSYNDKTELFTETYGMLLCRM